MVAESSIAWMVPVKYLPKTNSSLGIRSLGVVVLVIDSREGSMDWRRGSDASFASIAYDRLCFEALTLRHRSAREVVLADERERGSSDCMVQDGCDQDGRERRQQQRGWERPADILGGESLHKDLDQR